MSSMDAIEWLRRQAPCQGSIAHRADATPNLQHIKVPHLGLELGVRQHSCHGQLEDLQAALASNIGPHCVALHLARQHDGTGEQGANAAGARVGRKGRRQCPLQLLENAAAFVENLVSWERLL